LRKKMTIKFERSKKRCLETPALEKRELTVKKEKSKGFAPPKYEANPIAGEPKTNIKAQLKRGERNKRSELFCSAQGNQNDGKKWPKKVKKKKKKEP